MKSVLLLLLLAAFSTAAELSEECQYVVKTRNLTEVAMVESCFNNYTLDQEVVDVIIKNLEIIKDVYPYVDISKNPPSEPTGYFKKVDYQTGLAELKAKLASSDRIISKVVTPVQEFINSFRDGHFSLTFSSTEAYDNIFSSVRAFFPFKWSVDAGESYAAGERHVILSDPDEFFLSPETKQTIEDMFSQGYYAVSVDGIDAFKYFSGYLGDHNSMKSPQGRLYLASLYSTGFKLLSCPTDGIFKEHKIVFSDNNKTEISFNFGFKNYGSSEGFQTPVAKNSFDPAEDRETLKLLKNFKMRSKRAPHELVVYYRLPGLNMIKISSFAYEGAKVLQFMYELVECVEQLDKNDDPIAILMQRNGGGKVMLEALTQFLLMPLSDFRIFVAARKTEKTKHIAVDKEYFAGSASNDETCAKMEDSSDVDSFWKDTEIDTFGNVTHERTKKAISFYGDYLKFYGIYQLSNLRAPTDYIVLTDGFCFSSCSIFVNNVIRTGWGIVAGYGVTNPDDELFTAAQCPSYVIDPADYFEEIQNNSDYGLGFQVTLTETYNVTGVTDKSRPGDYDILRIDTHTHYYEGLNPVIRDIAEHALSVHEEYKTKCNPANKHLLMESSCKVGDVPNALLGGYACGANGEWNTTTCKVLVCEPPYVVDHDNNKCVLNTCYPGFKVSSSVSPPPPPTSPPSGAFSVVPTFIAVVVAAFTALFNPVH